MTRALSAFKVSAELIATLTNTVDGSAQTASCKQGARFTPATLASGTSANQADRIWSDTGRTLTSGNDEDLDLYDLGTVNIGAGAGLDALGQSVALAEIVGLLVVNDADSAGNLLVGGEGSAAAWNSLFNGDDDALILLRPGGFFCAYAPTDPAWAVADSSNHLLTMAADSGDVTYDIHLMGRSG